MKKMNDDMPWVNLTQEEVEELRNKKHELTEYGKQKLRELKMKQIAQKCVAAARNVAEGSPTLGKLIREGRDPMITKTYYEYAAVLRVVMNELQQSPGVIMCPDVLELCEELEKL
jgi:hypothetical protein